MLVARTLEALRWTEPRRPVDPEWQLVVRGPDVTLIRTPAVEGRPVRSWTGQLSARQREGLDAALAHYGVLQMPDEVLVAAGGGELVLAAPDTRRALVFSARAQESCPEESWLSFPEGAATRAVELFSSLRHAVLGSSSTLQGWRAPPRRGKPAGERCDPDERLVLSYAAQEPNVIDSRARYRRTSWFFSGRVRCSTVFEDVETNRVTSRRRWEARLPAAMVQAEVEALRRSGFFDALGTMTGTRYDGTERLVCHYRGARLEKTLCYEVEMGARAGLTSTENEGLDRVRALERRAEAERAG